MTACDSIEPAAHRKIGDRDFLFAKRLNGLRRNLDVAKQCHMRDIPHSHFVYELVLVFDCQNLVFAAHAITGCVEIQRTGDALQRRGKVGKAVADLKTVALKGREAAIHAERHGGLREI